MKVCKQYKDLLQNILDNGIWREDPNRQGTKRLQVPFTTMSVDLREGFPVLTTKKMWWKGIVLETLHLLKGNSNIKELVDQGINIWNKDAYNYHCKVSDDTIGKNEFKIKYDEFINHIKNDNSQKAIAGSDYKFGDIGRIYGVQWRNWTNVEMELDPFKGDEFAVNREIDQLKNAINTIKENPLSSNIRIFGDNPADADNQALPCCMDYMQFTTEPYYGPVTGDLEDNLTDPKHYLDLTIHYRSWDVLLGAPWNIAQYALILEIIAKITNKIPRNLNIVANNIHLYDNQIDAVKEQLNRGVYKYDLPNLIFSDKFEAHKGFNLDEFLLQLEPLDFKLENYKSYPKLDNQPEMISYD